MRMEGMAAAHAQPAYGGVTGCDARRPGRAVAVAEAGSAGRMAERDALLMRGLNVRRAAGLPVEGPAVPLPGGLQARLLHPAARLLQGEGLSYLVVLFCRGPRNGL